MNIPYGSTYLPCEVKADILMPHPVEKQHQSGSDIVRKALYEPIGSKCLSEIAKGKSDCTIIISDHTRPVPSRDILPPVIEELKDGNPDIKVRFLVATGCHRITTKEELIGKLGEELYNAYPVIVHDCDANDQIDLGALPSGARCIIDRAAVETDLLISEGFIEPHFFAGFSGGRKSVLPGIAARKTVLGNHCGNFIHQNTARTGILSGNPIHEDMKAAAAMAGLQFIVNVIIDENGNTIRAFAGDPVKAHEAGCEELRRSCLVKKPDSPYDIVITSNGGAPLDQNVYQCVKSMTAAECCVKEGGTIILCAACADGIGGEDFYRSLNECVSPAELYETCRHTPQSETIPDQWQSQILARILMKANVIFVTDISLKEKINAMKMRYAFSIDEALQMARCVPESHVCIIPNGVSVILA